MANTTLGSSKESVLWKLFHDVSTAAKAQSLSKADARELIIKEMAAAYRIPPSQLTAAGEPVLYANISKLLRLVFPKNTYAAANLERELLVGGLSFNEALELARGHVVTRRKRSSGDTIPRDPEDLQLRFTSIIEAAVRDGMSIEEIQQVFAAAVEQRSSDDPWKI